ncbi:MAG: peptide chain release factor aRF-1, partial [Euryarchaeota archaeon]|nr:peptide chain release factor aRF-1 [Euryarchaeota archaeon]
DVTNQMRAEYAQAGNIKSKRTRTNVQGAISMILQRLKLFNKPPENGLAIFCGTIPTGPITEKMEIYLVEPPEPVGVYLYRCDEKFFLDPLKDMIKEKETFGLLVIDRKEATIGTLRGKHVEVLKKLTSGVMGKHDAGGQSAKRFERLIEQAVHEFFDRLGKKANELFLGVPELKGVIIGGPGPTKEEFSSKDYLDYRLKEKVIGLIDTGYTDEYGIQELVNKASEVIEELDITKEKKLVQRFFAEVVKDKGLATYGEAEVRHFLSAGSVEILLLSEALRKFRVKVKCSNQSCDYGFEKTVSDVEQFKEELGVCPKCESTLNIKSQLIVVEAKDVVDELSDLAEKTGASVEMISVDTEEGGQLLNSFGGVAAILRYRA